MIPADHQSLVPISTLPSLDLPSEAGESGASHLETAATPFSPFRVSEINRIIATVCRVRSEEQLKSHKWQNIDSTAVSQS